MDNDAISRSALQEATLRRLTIGKWADGHLELRPTITTQELDRLLTDAPALDVAPVVHARWICSGDMDSDGNSQGYCSRCGAGDKHRADLKNLVPYCWKCGARMDGDANA